MKSKCGATMARLAAKVNSVKGRGYVVASIIAAGLLPVAAQAQDNTPPTGTAVDVSGYAQTFADAKASLLAVISGPGTLAFGVMLVGLIFAVVWKLYRKGIHSFG